MTHFTRWGVRAAFGRTPTASTDTLCAVKAAFGHLPTVSSEQRFISRLSADFRSFCQTKCSLSCLGAAFGHPPTTASLKAKTHNPYSNSRKASGMFGANLVHSIVTFDGTSRKYLWISVSFGTPVGHSRGSIGESGQGMRCNNFDFQGLICLRIESCIYRVS